MVWLLSKAKTVENTVDQYQNTLADNAIVKSKKHQNDKYVLLPTTDNDGKNECQEVSTKSWKNTARSAGNAVYFIFVKVLLGFIYWPIHWSHEWYKSYKAEAGTRQLNKAFNTALETKVNEHIQMFQKLKIGKLQEPINEEDARSAIHFMSELISLYKQTLCKGEKIKIGDSVSVMQLTRGQKRKISKIIKKLEAAKKEVITRADITRSYSSKQCEQDMEKNYGLGHCG